MKGYGVIAGAGSAVANDHVGGDCGREYGDLRELKRFDSPIYGVAKAAAAKLLDKDVTLNYNASQAITG